MSIFSDTQPTEDGVYWILASTGAAVALLERGFWFWRCSRRPVGLMPRGFQFGPRIPTPDELASLYEDREHLKRLTENTT